MNYCDSDKPATEPCKCHTWFDPMSIPDTTLVCAVGQSCAEISERGVYLRSRCVAQCALGQSGPCMCKTGDDTFKLAKAGSACVPRAQGAVLGQILPVAELNQLLREQSVCVSGDEEEICAPGTMCGKLENGAAKCGTRCLNGSIALADCLCRAADGTHVVATKHQLCDANGAASKFTGSVCPTNSVSHGECSCSTGQAFCAAGSVCVTQNRADVCMAACAANNYNKTGAPCACRGTSKLLIVAADEMCVFDDDGEPVAQNTSMCSNGRIQGCICDGTNSPVNKRLYYENDASLCVLAAGSNDAGVYPLMEVGAYTERPLGCAVDSNGVKFGVLCDFGYCMENDYGNAACVERCDYDMVAAEPCACVKPDASAAEYARVGDFCSINGVVSDGVENECWVGAISPGACKCPATAAGNCAAGDYCARNSSSAQCLKACDPTDTSDAAHKDCVCAHSGSDALIPAGSVCACAHTIWAVPVCAVQKLCEAGQSGPCACDLDLDGLNVRPIGPAQACVNKSTRMEMMLLCTDRLVANQQCACANAPSGDRHKSVVIDAGSVCIQKTDGTAEIMYQCETYKELGASCACRASSDSAAMTVCRSGSICALDAVVAGNANAASTTAVQQYTCLAKCVPGVDADVSCVCGSSVTGLAAAPTCAAKQLCTVDGRCVTQCVPNQVAAQKCDCFKSDGSVAGSADIGQACAQVGLDFAVLNVCTAETHSQCACRLKTTELGVTSTPNGQFCLKTTDGFALYEQCTDATAPNAICACGAESNLVQCKKSSCVANSAIPGRSVCACDPEMGADANPDAECLCGAAMCTGAQSCIENDKCVAKCGNAKATAECACGQTVCAAGMTCKNNACTGNGLSAGAIAGIVIGAVVAVGAVAVGVFFALRAAKAKKTTANASTKVQQYEEQSVLASVPVVE